MTNVIAFPKTKLNCPPTNMEQLLESVEATRKEHIEYVVDDLLSMVFSRSFDEGFNLGDDECMKSTSMLVESLRSALYSTIGIDHPFQLVASALFSDEDDESSDENSEEIPEDLVDIITE